jgi:hypothetical protein
MEKDVRDAITYLVLRLQKDPSADAALRYSQSALNLMHVLQINKQIEPNGKVA